MFWRASNGLHLAFLDPYGLRALPFSIIQTLAAQPSLDILLHFSIMDLRRNLGKFLSGELRHLDEFVPGWREHIDPRASEEAIFTAVEAHWRKLVADLGKPARGVELVEGPTRQRLYWLILLSRSARAEDFFRKISYAGRQTTLSFERDD